MANSPALSLPKPMNNEARMNAALERARQRKSSTHVLLATCSWRNIRAYREKMMSGSGIQPLFPLWCSAAETPSLARAHASERITRRSRHH